MSEIHTKSDADLVKFVTEKRDELQKIRFGGAGSGMRNTRASRNIRREIATALTEMHKRSKVGA